MLHLPGKKIVILHIDEEEDSLLRNIDVVIIAFPPPLPSWRDRQ